MATTTTTIGQLGEITVIAPDDMLEVEQATSGLSKRVSSVNLIGANITGGGTIATNGHTVTVSGPATLNGSYSPGADVTQAAINGATEKTTPVDADTLGLIDTAASNILKKLSWANLKATLKSFFDGLYVALTGAQSIAGLKTFLGGISFGDETLSVYDLGTWGPVIADAATGGNTGTASTQLGWYIKIGTLCFMTGSLININTTGMTAGNALFVRNIPFASLGSASHFSVGVASVGNAVFTGQAIANLPNNATALTIVENTSGAPAANLIVSDYTSGTAVIVFAMVYRTAS